MRAVVLLFLACALCASATRYTGFKIIRVYTTREGARLLTDRDVELGIDVMGATGQYMDVISDPAKLHALKQALNSQANTTWDVQEENLQDVFDQEAADLKLAKLAQGNVSASERCGGANYCTYAETVEWIKALTAAFPRYIEPKTVPGTSYEGRTVPAIMMADPEATPKFTVYLDSLIHAREWITGGSLNYFIRWFAEGLQARDPVAVKLASQARFLIVPIVNVDGYVFTESSRLWRKTRTPNPSVPNCIGKDANRNMPVGFGGGGSSNDPCSAAYRGPAPFSEPVVANLYRDFLGQYFDNIELSISFHCSGRMWMCPYGDIPDYPPNYDQQMAAGQEAVNAIRARLGETYALGTCYHVIYQASGITVDYMYVDGKIPYSYTPELDTTFTTPVSRIVPTGEAMRDAIVNMVQYIHTQKV